MSDGLIIRVEDTKDDGKPFKVVYLISYGKDGSLKGGSHREMAKIYKRERVVKRIVNELNEKSYCKAVALPTECPECYNNDIIDSLVGWKCECCGQSGPAIY